MLKRKNKLWKLKERTGFGKEPHMQTLSRKALPLAEQSLTADPHPVSEHDDHKRAALDHW